MARRAANRHDPDYTLTVSAPTNAEARAMASAIRERRRGAGDLGPDQVVLDACDQNGAAYALPLAAADRVRLFDGVNAACADRSRGLLGNNGSVPRSAGWVATAGGQLTAEKWAVIQYSD